MLQHRIPPTECCPSQKVPMWGSHKLQFLKDCCNMGLYHRVHPAKANCSSTGGSSHGWQFPQELLFWCGLLSMGFSMDVCSDMVLHGLQGTACFTMVFSMGCSAPVTGAFPHSLCSLAFVFTLFFLTFFFFSSIFSLLSSSLPVKSFAFS